MSPSPAHIIGTRPHTLPRMQCRNPWRTTARNVHQKILRNGRKQHFPSLSTLLLLLLLRSPRQPHPSSLSDRECRSSMSPRRCRTDRGGPIAGGTKFHPAVGQRGGPPTCGYNTQMRWDLRKYPTVAAPPSIGRGRLQTSYAVPSRLRSRGIHQEAWEREGTVKDPTFPEDFILS